MFHLSPQPTFLKKQAASTSDQRDTKPPMLDQALDSGRKKPDLSRSGSAYKLNYELIPVYECRASMSGYVGTRTAAPAPAPLPPARRLRHRSRHAQIHLVLIVAAW